MTEQYVLQQLVTNPAIGVGYYTNDRGNCEIDFLVDDGEKVIPLEVKAEINLRSKRLKSYQEEYAQEVSVRTSMADYKENDVPLYVI